MIRTSVLLAALALTGCLSYLIKPAVDRYCALPPAEREAYGAVINTRAAPHEIAVTCRL